MNPDAPKLVPLAAEHDVSSFNCGKPEFDKWLSDYALASHKADLARTWVLVEDDRVIGYFSLVMGHVRPEDAPQKLVQGVPRYPVGMVLLARLAVDGSAQGRGLGADLLAHALVLACRAGEVVAARLVAVDAIDEQAAAFYRRWGFVPVPEQPLKLYRRIKDIRRTLDRE
ncbi:MAG TPA: GNAT family N-acetyltransferase [Pseudonocardiaceae bacterium]|nr:GNAT family N-acetyltransferase [Pseudonocardiaceae bacterium]